MSDAVKAVIVALLIAAGLFAFMKYMPKAKHPHWVQECALTRPLDECIEDYQRLLP